MKYQFKTIYHSLNATYCVTDITTTDDSSVCLLDIAEKPEYKTLFKVKYDWTQGIFLERIETLLANTTPAQQKNFQDLVKKMYEYLEDGDVEYHYHMCRGCGRNDNCTRLHSDSILIIEDFDFSPIVLGDLDICSRCLEKEQLETFKKTVMDLARPVLDMRQKWRKDFPEKEIPHAVSHVETELGRKIAELIEASNKTPE